MGLPPVLDFARANRCPRGIEPSTQYSLQVCGWPLPTIYAGQAMILGVPAYDAARIAPARPMPACLSCGETRPVRSVADLRGCYFVFNSIHSNSGMNLPRRVIAELAGSEPFFGSIVETHSQPINLERVARGEADATCVDCVTYAFFARYRPTVTKRLRILAATRPTPAIHARHRHRDRSGDKDCACTGAATRGHRARMGARAGRDAAAGCRAA